MAAGRVLPGIGGPFASGSLDLDICDPNFFVILNGLDPSSPLAFLAQLGPAANPEFSTAFFLSSNSAFPAGLQAVVTDPNNPGGYRLTAAVDFFSQGPAIASVSPNSGPAGGGNVIMIQGSGLIDPNISVTINGLPCSILTQNPSLLQVVVPTSGITGPVDVAVSSYSTSVSSVGGYTYFPGNGVRSVLEAFTTTASHDASVLPTFGTARWGDPTAPGELTGTAISGSPLATFLGNPSNLGTRTQVNMPIGPGTNLPLAVVSPGLFSPFDNANNNFPGANPNGGSRIMHLVEAQDLGSINSSLELVEWGVVGDTVQQATYPDFEIWAGMTSRSAPIGCNVAGSSGAGVGLSNTFAFNYDLPTRQAPDQANLNPNMSDRGGVLVRNAAAYATPSSITSYFPYPRFDRPFDYIGSGAGAGNLVLEMNAEINPTGGNNGHRYRAAALSPIRRIVGLPRSSGAGGSILSASACVIYDLRFTFVQSTSTAQSTFYDTTVSMGVGAFSSLDLSPLPSGQPAGTYTRFEVQGASALANPSTPMGPSTAWLTYIDGGPSNVTTNPLVLQNVGDPNADQLTGNQYFRFRTTLRANHITNTLPSYSQMLAVIQL